MDSRDVVREQSGACLVVMDVTGADGVASHVA